MLTLISLTMLALPALPSICVRRNHGPYVMNNPSGALSDEQQDWLDNLIFREHFVSINTAFVTTTIAHPEFEAEAMPAMLKTAFKSILGLKNLLALRSGPMNALLKTPEAAHHFGTVEQEGAGGLALYRCTRCVAAAPRSATVQLGVAIAALVLG